MEGYLDYRVRPTGDLFEVRLADAHRTWTFASLTDATRWAVSAARLAWLDREVPAFVRVIGDDCADVVAAAFGPPPASVS